MANTPSNPAVNAMISYRQQERSLLNIQLKGLADKPQLKPLSEAAKAEYAKRTGELTDRIKTLDTEIAQLNAPPAPAPIPAPAAQ